LQITAGEIVAGGREYRYALCWWLLGGKPVVAELAPTLDDVLRLRRGRSSAAALADELPPAPVIALDPVAAELWRVEPRRGGLPFAAVAWRRGGAARPPSASRTIPRWWQPRSGRPSAARRVYAARVPMALARTGWRRAPWTRRRGRWGRCCAWTLDAADSG